MANMSAIYDYLGANADSLAILWSLPLIAVMPDNQLKVI
jgi:hypothetical protein